LNSEVFELTDLNDVTSIIDTIEINDPREKSEKTERIIVFLYGRTIDQNQNEYKDADYCNGFYYNNNYNNKTLRTIIPMTGKITFSDNWKDRIKNVSIAPYNDTENNFHLAVPNLAYEIDDSRMTLATMTAKSGDDLGTVFQNEGNLKYDSESNSAEFDLKLPNGNDISKYDWNCNLNNVFLDSSIHRCYLSMPLRIYVEYSDANGKLTGKYIRICTYSSDIVPENYEYYKSVGGKSIVYIPKIMIFWGCYADDVIITMVDGSSKKACEIHTGDVVKDFNGKSLTVSNVLVGDDNEIFKIETTDGKNIKVSGSHAMKLCNNTYEDETIAAAKLKIGDKLKTVSGFSVVSSVQKIPYSGKVYNFTFVGEETPNYLDANGFCAGDYYAQNNLDIKPKEQSDNAKKIISVCRRFINDRNSKMKPVSSFA
jgi:hypothetical protein